MMIVGIGKLFASVIKKIVRKIILCMQFMFTIE